MGDLISRQMAIDSIQYAGKIGKKTCVDILKRLPSAQQERKKGRWYDVGSLSCRCSECGCKAPKEYSFCPNCGAEMDEQCEIVCDNNCEECKYGAPDGYGGLECEFYKRKGH